MSDVQSAAPAAPAPAVSSAPVDAELPVTNDEVADEESDETVEEVAVKPASKEEKKSSKKKYSAKVNGKSRDVELDPSNDEEILQYIQKAMAADEKFEEAASLRKNVEQLVNTLKTNPLEILKHPELGINVKDLAQMIMNQELDDLAKSPEQKKLEEMERKLKDYEEEKTRLESEKHEAEKAKIQEQAFRQLDEDITSALASSELPKSPYVIKRIADTMIEAVNLGYPDVTVKDILPLVEQQIQEEIRQMFEIAPEEVFDKLTDKYLGKQTLNRMRQKRLAKTKKPIETAKQIQDTGKTSKTEGDSKKAEKVRFKDIFGNF